MKIMQFLQPPIMAPNFTPNILSKKNLNLSSSQRMSGHVLQQQKWEAGVVIVSTTLAAFLEPCKRLTLQVR